MAPERKQVKKFLKPKAENGGEEAPKKSGRVGYVLALGAVATVAIAAYLMHYQSAPATVSVAHTVPVVHKKPADKSPIDRRVPDPAPAKKSEVPSYDDYVKQAKANKWAPSDPVQKLESSILRHKQVLDVLAQSGSNNTMQFIGMLLKEMQYVVAVLGAATDRTIDLTPALHHAIDIIPDITYSIMKYQLANGGSKQDSRANAEEPRHWRYHSITELVKLALVDKPAHIIMDFETSERGEAPLVKVVKHRVHALVVALMRVGASSKVVLEALRIAVLQADDLGAAQFFSILTTTAASSVAFPNHAQLVQEVGSRLPELLALARQLGYLHIAGRIEGVIQRLAGNVSDVPGEVPADKVDFFNEYFPYRRVPVVPSEPAPIEHGTEDPLTGYSQFQLDPVHTIASNGFDAYLNQCAVDRVDIADMSTDRFHAEYVTLNRPVVITHAHAEDSAEESASKDPARVWTVDSLLKRFGSTEEVSSTIPYATLFGHKEGVVTLKDFIAHPSTGMQAFTRRMQEAVQPFGTSLSEQQLLEVASTVGLPQYIFSGVQQNMNKAMRKHMLKTVQRISASTPASAESANHLLELMYAVARGYNATASSEGGTARKLHKDFRDNWKSQFYLGPALSGAPFHNHGPAFNVLVHGKKEWTLMPPGRDLYSNLHPVEWLREGGTASTLYLYHKDAPPAVTQGSAPGGLRTDQPCKLIQRPGEVLFVPRHWTHQILNLAESVGFAVEIDDYVA